MTPTVPSESLWERAKLTLNTGPTAYGFFTLYALICSGLLISNTRTSLATDVIFVFFLLLVLLVYRSSTHTFFKLAVVAFQLGVVLPYFGTLNPFYIEVATQAGIFVALALGLNVVVGFAGLLDLGYVAFFAVGAYAWAILSTSQITQINPAWMPLAPSAFYPFLFVGLLLGAITGVLLGLPVLRLRGDYLAIVTLGFGEVIRVLANNLDRPVNFTNGSQGIREIERPNLFFADFVRDTLGWNLTNQKLHELFFYFAVLFIVIMTVLVVTRLKESRIGRAWEAIREDETAAIAQGIPLVRTKLLAFAVGASFAGAMGVIFASKQLFINPPTFDLLRSINILAMVILGGMGSIPGVMLGAVLVTLLDLQLLPRAAAVLRDLQRMGLPIPAAFDPTQYQRLLFGILLVVMMIFRPQGILPDERRKEELAAGDVSVDDDDDSEDDSPPAAAKPNGAAV
ncbi:MAG: branched-chain amino acid ABC transporter permease [Candidatus Viridilinea halotolerans]|uniref:Branched-chain amino acid ABC transporter permease n=1 Tax=Candidatus Viridilinea halotolerans TaxID=2491704 RepID=A0A426TWS8_9CHLR|nr:MAG: branched-chain amino acid ABC transporter permease [Candidatus Viridilinea halotolerans]